MSSHHSQRFFNLHYKQLADAGERRQARRDTRLGFFLSTRALIRAEVERDVLIIFAFGFGCFVYIAVSTPLYLDYVFRAFVFSAS